MINLDIELNKAYGEGFKILALIFEDDKVYKGVSLKNACFRDMISAEQGLLGNYLIYSNNRLEDIKDIYFYTDEESFEVFKNIRYRFLEEFLNKDVKLHFINKNRIEKVYELNEFIKEI